MAPPARSSLAHLALLGGACLLLLLAWAGVLLLVFRPDPIPWAHLETLPRGLQDTYTVGMYLLAPVAAGWFWRGLERRPWAELQLQFRPRALLEGLLMGAAAIAFTYLVALLAGWTRFLPPPSWPWRDTLLALVAALTMGLVEELLFRGILLRALLRDHRPAVAVGLSAGLFALAHCFRPGMGAFDLVTSWGGLFATGLLLGTGATLRGIWLAVGLHAPWIAFIGLSSQHNLWAYLPPGHLWTGNGYPPRGLLTLAVMLGATAWLVWTARRERQAGS